MSFTVVVPDFKAVMYECRAAVRAVAGVKALIEGYQISSRYSQRGRSSPYP